MIGSDPRQHSPSFPFEGDHSRRLPRRRFDTYALPAVAACALVAVLLGLFGWLWATDDKRAVLAPPPSEREVPARPEAAPTVPPAGGVYAWRDAQGRRHFGDRPPSGVLAERIDPSRLQPNRMAPLVPSDPPRSRSAQRYAAEASVPTATNASAPDWESSARAGECAWIEREIEWIDARMRQGYREPYGERLREERRRLKDRHYALRCAG